MEGKIDRMDEWVDRWTPDFSILSTDNTFIMFLLYSTISFYEKNTQPVENW